MECNAHLFCCEVSPTEGPYDHCQSDDLGLYSRSQVRLKTTVLFNLQYIEQYLSYYIQTLYDGRLMDALHAHTRFDDLDLGAR